MTDSRRRPRPGSGPHRAGRVLLFLLLGAGCSGSETPAGGCQADTDCGGGRICYETECVPPAKLACVEGGSKAPHVAASPVTLDLGTVAGRPVSGIVEVSNAGDCTLQIRSVEVDDGLRFACSSCPEAGYPVDVYPGRTHRIEVLATPGTLGRLDDTLIILTNDPEATEVRIPLSAQSIGPPKLSVSHGEVDFGYVPVGASRDVVVQAINAAIGSAPLTIESVTVEGSDAFSIALDPALPAELAPARSDLSARLAVTVTFAPAMEAVHTATLTITPDVGDPIDVLLYGAKDPPDLSVTPASIDFGTVLLGEVAYGQVTLQNTGRSGLIATRRLQIGHPDVTIPRQIPEVRPGGVYQLDVIYEATLAGPMGDTILIESNDPEEPTISVSLRGTGQATGNDVVALELLFDNGSDTALDADLRDVDLFLESPDGRVCGEVTPMPDWGTYGRPRWSASGPKENPERILLPDAMEDGRFPVMLTYVEDCATLPTALTAQLLGLGTDELVDYLSDGEVDIDPAELSEAVETTCVERKSANPRVKVTINGAPAGEIPVDLSTKGDSAVGLTLVRAAGTFSVER